MKEAKQIDFLEKIIPRALLIQEYCYYKAEFNNILSPAGVYPSVLVAEMLIRSDWGRHRVAHEEIVFETAKGVSKRYSNNLVLLEVGKHWKGKSNIIDGINYRAYRDWQVFAADYSDHLVFSGEFDNLLKEPNPTRQFEIFSLTKDRPEEYHKSMVETISIAQWYLDGRKETGTP